MVRTIQKRTVLALLVGANGLVRLKLNRALEQEHFEVLWTATTQKAVAAYNRRPIDLLLLDLNQPLKVGWDIFEPVGALHPALPIVVITEKGTELEPTVVERMGARLEKPFSLHALIQTMHLLLNQPDSPVNSHAQRKARRGKFNRGGLPPPSGGFPQTARQRRIPDPAVPNQLPLSPRTVVSALGQYQLMD